MRRSLAKQIEQEDIEFIAAVLTAKERSASEKVGLLEEFHQRFEHNRLALLNFRQKAAGIRLQLDYEQDKARTNETLQYLQKQVNQLDNRIIAVEQKLARGIPEDLLVMEKLITEQEAIVADQERLNEAELALLAEISKIDIEFSNQQKILNRSSSVNSTDPVKMYDAKQFQAKQSKLILFARFTSLMILLLIPIFLDNLIGHNWLNTKAKVPSLLMDHYIFFISLIAMELFAGERIRLITAHLFTAAYFKQHFFVLRQAFEQNEAEISSLEKTYRVDYKTDINI
ncbi:hypothetical protein [Pedobacter aquatilis]|uniref:hypothetical protein n=1 Tax=Pedobacter aquatilis TaxID=351343 RepID=UPI00292CD81E|nr:hypothetical protein [Pedobacter aquatilis]